jgi:outer membrane lipoprotein
MKKVGIRFYRYIGGTIALAGLIAIGCAPIPKQFSNEVAPGLTFAGVQGNPDAYKGKTVLWGGEILSVKTEKRGTTLEVLQAPLNYRDKPERGDTSEGRFLAFSDRYLDPAVYRPRRMVTVVGRVEGVKVRELAKGQVEYSYPCVLVSYLHLWPKHKRIYYYYPDYYWGPFWYWTWGPNWDWE